MSRVHIKDKPPATIHRNPDRTAHIPPSLWIIHALVVATDELTAAQLAERAGVNHATAWHWLKRLERIGLAVRRRECVGKNSRADYWKWRTYETR